MTPIKKEDRQNKSNFLRRFYIAVFFLIIGFILGANNERLYEFTYRRLPWIHNFFEEKTDNITTFTEESIEKGKDIYNNFSHPFDKKKDTSEE